MSAEKFTKMFESRMKIGMKVDCSLEKIGIASRLGELSFRHPQIRM